MVTGEWWNYKINKLYYKEYKIYVSNILSIFDFQSISLLHVRADLVLSNIQSVKYILDDLILSNV
jgi:hypothetical protein